MELLAILQEPWAIRALLASGMVGIMCGILGCFIVLRNMSLVGDALAHAILPGVVVAFLIVGYSTLAFFTGSVIAGLLTAVAITWIQHRVQTKNDAAIGIVFTAMFSFGVIGISYLSQHQGVHLDLKDFLFGNVLGVANTDLLLTGLVLAYVLISITAFYRYLFTSTFQPIVAETMGMPVQLIHYFLMLLLSFAVVASLQTVGVILVVAMLITPAATALLLSNQLERVLFLAAGFGLLSAVTGLLAAVYLDTTPGPAMALMATLFYLMAVFLAPKRGLIAHSIRKWQLKLRIDREDILKALYRADIPDPDRIREQLEISAFNWRSGIRRLRSKGWLENAQFALTTTGQKEARRLVRAHRLWETYLANEVGLPKEQIHADAERHEHLLSDDILRAVDKKLGYPTVDPHGSPIPRHDSYPQQTLGQSATGEQLVIASEQTSSQVSAALWKLQLPSGALLRVQNRYDDQIHVNYQGKIISIAANLAQQINVEAK